MKKLFCVFAVLLCALFLYSDNFDWTKPAKRIADGILLGQIAAENPNQNVYCLRIDTEMGYKFYTTPRISDEEGYIDGERETWKKTLKNFMKAFQSEEKLMLVAVNNDFFSPWPPKNPNDPANLINFSVSDGVLVSSPVGTPAFIVDKNGKCSIREVKKGDDISDVWVACGSNGYVLKDGNPIKGDGAFHPRTVCGVSQDGKYVFFMVIDGRRHRSRGADNLEEGNWLKYFGAYNGINFDGGGSSAMVYWDITERKTENRCKFINQPNAVNWLAKTQEEEDAGFYIQERNLGNSLGVYKEIK